MTRLTYFLSLLGAFLCLRVKTNCLVWSLGSPLVGPWCVSSMLCGLLEPLTPKLPQSTPRITSLVARAARLAQESQPPWSLSCFLPAYNQVESPQVLFVGLLLVCRQEHRVGRREPLPTCGCYCLPSVWLKQVLRLAAGPCWACGKPSVNIWFKPLRYLGLTVAICTSSNILVLMRTAWFIQFSE